MSACGGQHYLAMWSLYKEKSCRTQRRKPPLIGGTRADSTEAVGLALGPEGQGVF